jgi:N-acetyl-gamma-glutamyl-phosphate reductase
LKEIRQSLVQLQSDFDKDINFIPVRGNFSRGIFVSSYIKCDLELSELRKIYEDFYADAAFTFMTEANPDLKQVVNTNKVIIQVNKHGDKVLILTVIDNLLKGASGQAVQNMNLMFGLEETCGLKLKSVAF